MTVIDVPPETFARPRGRAVPELPLYTFKGSGIQCRLRRLSPVTLQRLQQSIVKEWRKLPPEDDRAMPTPPIELISIGGAEPRPESNPNHPDYQAALKTWNERVGVEVYERLARLAALDACVFEPGDIDEVWCERFENRMRAEGADLNVPDIYSGEERAQIIWVIHRCLGSQDDLNRFLKHVSGQSEITEEAVGDHTATFPTAG